MLEMTEQGEIWVGFDPCDLDFSIGKQISHREPDEETPPSEVPANDHLIDVEEQKDDTEPVKQNKLGNMLANKILEKAALVC